jgi:uncharacterized 2Fe-2S/4Fe-4S cluster protein (DUF4445 family)
MPDIYFKAQNITVKLPAGTTILQAAKSAGVMIESPCGGVGTCGKCRVLVENLTSENVICQGARQLPAEEKTKKYVLSCQAKVYDDLTVITQSTEAPNKTLKILSEGHSFSYELRNYITKRFDGEKTLIYGGDEVLGVESGDTTSFAYGLVIDIGTTTLVAALIDLLTGKELASVSALNPQSLHAQDVLTRIHFAAEEEGLQLLYNEVTDEINRLIDSLVEKTQINREHIYEVIYSANTAMLHLACKINPASLGQFPYASAITGGGHIPAAMLQISRFGIIYLPPVISAYVGPDITSGVLASQLYKKEGITLFIDIGTNGEMVLAKDGLLSAASTAAGPAFEGMNITYGMRAENGAVETFQITENDEIETHVIGDIPAAGICGSGLLDIAAELVRVGIIGKNGSFVPPQAGNYSDKLKSRMVQRDGNPCFQVAQDVFFTQQDIRQVQLAKGAIRAGIEVLLQRQEIKAEDVNTVEIAGSFGYHLRQNSLLEIGLLPKEFAGKIKFVGNTSQAGGKALLLNTQLRRTMNALVKEIVSVELADDPSFESTFVKALSF